MKRIVPGFSSSDHGIEDGEELAHASDDGDLSGLSRGDEALVELLDGGVEVDGHQRRHRARARRRWRAGRASGRNRG